MSQLTFIPINLQYHKEICIEFRTDTFIESFGSAEAFLKGKGFKGPDEYILLLSERIKKDPESTVHIWEEDQIIGQIELCQDQKKPEIGFIFLYYLKPSKRGFGYSIELDRYTCQYFHKRGIKRICLNVSVSNHRAFSFYLKMGWGGYRPRFDNTMDAQYPA